MKKVFLSLLLLLLGCLGWSLFAQERYSINEVFKGNIVPKEKIKEIKISHSSKLPDEIDFFRSLEFNADAATLEKIASLIEEDAKYALDSEMSTTAGVLDYALLRVGKEKDCTYICYSVKDAEEEGHYKVTILLLIGPDSIQELKSLFGK